MASPWPSASSRSATSGVVIRPTSSTGFDETSRIERAYAFSQPASNSIGVWMYAWWTPAETFT